MNKKQTAVIEALIWSMGTITPALVEAQVHPRQHAKWLQDDPKYKAEVEASIKLGEMVRDDFLKAKLLEACEELDTSTLKYCASIYLGDSKKPKPPIPKSIQDAPDAELKRKLAAKKEELKNRGIL